MAILALPLRGVAGIVRVRMKRTGVVLILLLAFAGLADSAYLARHEADGSPLICAIGTPEGCTMVAESPYSEFLGIPLSVYGILFYAIVFAVAALELALFDRLLRRVLQGLAAAGVLASVYFLAIQLFVIEALCIYCIGSAVLAFLIGALASFLEPWKRSLPAPAPAP